MIQLQQYILKQMMTTSILSIVQMLNGYSISWSSSMVLKLLDINQTPLSSVATDLEVSLITNIMFMGVFATYFFSYLSNRIGRRYSLILSGFIYCFSYLFLTFAVSTKMIIAARLLIGISVCAMQLLVYVYVGEMASPNTRGLIMTLLSIFQTIGCLIGFCLGPYVTYVQFGILPIALTVLFIVLSFFLHESPVYYVIKGDEERAKQALLYFGRNKDISNELKIMFENAKQSAESTGKWKEMLKKNNRKAFLIVIPIYIVEQASGIMAVILNATSIFKIAGSSVKPEIATMIVGVTNLVGNLISPFIVDTYGRKILLLISTGGCCVCMTILGTYFYFRQIAIESVSSLGWLPLTALVIALFTYNVGLTIIPHTLAGEMFSPNIRGIGSSIGMTCSNMSGLVTTSIYNYLVLKSGTHIAFWMFGVFDAVGFIFTAFVVPETKGKSLTEINSMLRR